MARSYDDRTPNGVSNPLKNEDLIGVSNEDGGGGFNLSKKIKISELVTFVRGLLFSGTPDTIPVYTTDGSTIGDSPLTVTGGGVDVTLLNGTLGIGVEADPTTQLNIEAGAGGEFPVFVFQAYTGGSDTNAIHGTSQGVNAGKNRGLSGRASGSTVLNTGAWLRSGSAGLSINPEGEGFINVGSLNQSGATGSQKIAGNYSSAEGNSTAEMFGGVVKSINGGSGDSIGLHIESSSTGGVSYIGQAEDGNEAIGKVLLCVTPDGKFQWGNIPAVPSDSIIMTATVNEAGGITKGQVVYLSGAASDPLVSLADNTDFSKASVLAIANETKLDTESILVTLGGKLENIDTSSFTANDILYLGTSGNITNVHPSGIDAVQVVGNAVVINAITGSIIVKLSPQTIVDTFDGIVRHQLVNESTASGSSMAYTMVNDAGHKASVSFTGENFIAPGLEEAMGFTNEGYGVTIFTIEGNKGYIWKTDVTDAHAIAATEKMALSAAGLFSLLNGVGINGISNDGTLVGNQADQAVTVQAAKTYADTIAAGQKPKKPARLATTTHLDNIGIGVWTNSGSGVGKTLTAGSVGIMTADGVNMILDDDIIIKNEDGSSANLDDVDHGIYTMTTEGTAGVAAILTRRTDFDGNPSSEVSSGAFATAREGDVNAMTTWMVYSEDPIIVDTDSIIIDVGPSNGSKILFNQRNIGTAADPTTTQTTSGTATVIPQMTHTFPIYSTTTEVEVSCRCNFSNNKDNNARMGIFVNGVLQPETVGKQYVGAAAEFHGNIYIEWDGSGLPLGNNTVEARAWTTGDTLTMIDNERVFKVKGIRQ